MLNMQGTYRLPYIILVVNKNDIQHRQPSTFAAKPGETFKKNCNEQFFWQYSSFTKFTIPNSDSKICIKDSLSCYQFCIAA